MCFPSHCQPQLEASKDLHGEADCGMFHFECIAQSQVFVFVTQFLRRAEKQGHATKKYDYIMVMLIDVGTGKYYAIF